MHALVRLLYDGALRIQDAVGLTFGDITLVQPDQDGLRYIRIDAKKTISRKIKFKQLTYDAIKRYQEKEGADDSRVMFQSTSVDDPAHKWVQALSRFFKKNNLDVQSHDFRKTFATTMYEKSKDISSVQKYLGHAKIATTQGYVEIDEEQMNQAVRKALEAEDQA